MSHSENTLMMEDADVANINPDLPPPNKPYEPTDQELINLYCQQLIGEYGWGQVELWFNEGWELKVVNNKVIWIK